MRNDSDPWGEDEIETLKRLWLEGCSAGQISRALEKRRTRNSVIGKVTRLGLPKRTGNAAHRNQLVGHPTKKDRRVNLNPARKTKSELRLEPEPDALTLNGALIGIDQVGGSMCRWPHGDINAPGFHFCAQPQKPSSSYCEIHAARAVQPGGKRPEPSAEAKALGQQAERQLRRMWG